MVFPAHKTVPRKPFVVKALDMFYAVIFFSALFIWGTEGQNLCNGVRGRDQVMRAHPYECTKYVFCVGERAMVYPCGNNKVFDGKECVDRSTIPASNDPCKQVRSKSLWSRFSSFNNVEPSGHSARDQVKLNSWRFSKPVCKPGSRAKFPHPTECAQYYDCAANPKEDWWGKHLRECGYPLLYNSTTQRCDHYANVMCGYRHVPVDPCEYIANQCRTSQCTPCNQRFASCKGYPNGLHPWSGREATPYFVVCKDERVVFHAKCISPNSGMTFVFDNRYHTCLMPKGGYKFP